MLLHVARTIVMVYKCVQDLEFKFMQKKLKSVAKSARFARRFFDRMLQVWLAWLAPFFACYKNLLASLADFVCALRAQGKARCARLGARFACSEKPPNRM